MQQIRYNRPFAKKFCGILQIPGRVTHIYGFLPLFSGSPIPPAPWLAHAWPPPPHLPIVTCCPGLPVPSSSSAGPSPPISEAGGAHFSPRASGHRRRHGSASELAARPCSGRIQFVTTLVSLRIARGAGARATHCEFGVVVKKRLPDLFGSAVKKKEAAHLIPAAELLPGKVS